MYNDGATNTKSSQEDLKRGTESCEKEGCKCGASKKMLQDL